MTEVTQQRAVNLPPGESETRGRLSTLFLPTATALAIVALLVRVIVDSDTWFQVAIGRDILRRVEVPRIDHYVAAAFNRPYHDSHWLFQVLLSLADSCGGMTAVGLLMIILWGCTLFFCYRASCRWNSTSICCLLVFLAAVACSDRFIPRPEVVSYLMVSVFYYLLQERRVTSVRHLTIFALLQAAWANSHGLFVIGPFMAGCYLLSVVISPGRTEYPEPLALLKLIAVLLVATLATPFGIEGWRYAVLLATEAGPNSSSHFQGLIELTPTFGKVARSFPDFWCYLLLLVAFVVTSVIALLKRKVSLARLVLVLALLGVSLTGRRNMTFLALTAAPLIAENLFRLRPILVFPRKLQVISALLLLGFASLPVSGIYYKAFNIPLRFGLGIARGAYSPSLPKFLSQIGFHGVVYTPPYLGGYSLYHGLTPMVDGRWEVYDPDVLDTVLNARFDRKTWNLTISSYDIRGVMVGYGEYDTDPLLQRLSEDQRFQNVYNDEAVSFWKRVY
ncbi:MAG: hypothetical protein P4L44_13525 [Oryzomonas sp.]|uniref:hypothetical protein n=1 Tax=Oryzomonas sp. TaxID=2855186 RepID=UPI00284BE4A8|nr:hypothetical protein [Oryzomonas sp.]MDR3580975.1 hypothetical protein [Oryzomonas sp.]